MHSKAAAGLHLVLVVVLVNSEELNWKIHTHKSIGRIAVSLIKCCFPYESVVLQHHLSQIYFITGMLQIKEYPGGFTKNENLTAN